MKAEIHLCFKNSEMSSLDIISNMYGLIWLCNGDWYYFHTTDQKAKH